jgi:hypothetical protein
MRAALSLLALATLGCGIGRSKMVVPSSETPDAATIAVLPDSSPLPDAVRADVRPSLPDGAPASDAVSPQPDLRVLSDGPPLAAPDVVRDLRAGDRAGDGGPPPPDGPPSTRPDLPPEGPPPITPDARRDGPPSIAPDVGPDGPPSIAPDVGPDGPPSIAPEAGPDGPPLITTDALTDVLPPPPPDVQPDTRRRRPDTGPPPQECTAGAACTADCTATCSVIGTMSCTCVDGVLSCGSCQLPPITVSPEPCPDNPNGTDCPTSGLACFAFGGSGSISGACVCMARGDSGTLRWSCILR